jgi:hypothetical protein
LDFDASDLALISPLLTKTLVQNRAVKLPWFTTTLT